jgi:pimeloyl-ACP methyl ester carboxylesterase
MTWNTGRGDDERTDPSGRDPTGRGGHGGALVGERRFDGLERRLAESPDITVPTITLEGDANGAPHPDPSAYAHKFSGKYEHRTVSGGVGHNLPQEAPHAFVEAIVDVAAN